MRATAHTSARAICPPFGEKPFRGADVAVAWPLARFQALILNLQVGCHRRKIETFLKKLSARAKVRPDSPLLPISLKSAGETAVTPEGAFRDSPGAGKKCPPQAVDLEIRGSECRNRTKAGLVRKPFESPITGSKRIEAVARRCWIVDTMCAPSARGAATKKHHVIKKSAAVWSHLQQLAPRTHLTLCSERLIHRCTVCAPKAARSTFGDLSSGDLCHERRARH
jgi:hypothetical protein